jgi:hypothetical protein
MKVTEHTLGRSAILSLGLLLVFSLTLLFKELNVFDALGIKAVIALLAGIALFGLVIGGEDSKRKLLYIGFATIAVGHRAIYVGRQSYFVPLDIILWTLFAVIALKKVFTREKGDFGVPSLLVFFTLWCIVVGAGNCFVTEWDFVLNWTSPLVVGLPAFLVVRHLIRTADHLKTILIIMMAVSLTMSVLAIVEYQFPAVENLLPWLFTGRIYLAQDGFRRAPFSYFGYSGAATFVVWGMAISYDYFFHVSNRLKQLVAVIVFALGGVAVYISGQRSSWLGVGLTLIVLNIPFGIRGVGGVAIIWGIVTQLSNQFWTRVNTVAVYFERGVVLDTSTEQRINRASWAWDTILDKPLTGGGYGHWLAHNVFLEIGSTIGVIPALAFAALIIQLVLRVVRTAWLGYSADDRRYGWLFLSLSTLWVVQMSVETIFQTPPFAAAHWAMMAVAWNLPAIFAATAASKHWEDLTYQPEGLIHDYSLSPNVQL